MAKNKNHASSMTQSQIIKEFGVTKGIIDKYFPSPRVICNSRNGYHYMRLWQREAVEAAMKLPEVQAAAAEYRTQRLEQIQREELRTILSAYSPESMIDGAKHLKRTFVLHVGPTNSGKTYHAVKALESSSSGCYLGPLRLLALEMYDRINADGVPCSLLTGEESIPCEGASLVASTIELCNYHTHYQCAVIDEAQLVADNMRGAAWLRAICLVDADEVHICLAPEALNYIESLVAQFGDPYSVVKHERLVPLVYSGRCTGYDMVQPGDALICFSRKSVLSTAALLERSGLKASVIYGALPPAARRSEVEKYTRGETSVVVATDAIGMGISLPIRRVIFTETLKFDGISQRPLNSGEVRQIAGRAGRYGMFDLGEVLTMTDDDVVENGLQYAASRTRNPCISFPREMLDSDYSLSLLLSVWQSLPPVKGFKREDMSEALLLLNAIREYAPKAERTVLFDLITCPVDVRTRELVQYWAACARAIITRRHVPRPWFSLDTLMDCEMQYKAYDIHHQLLRRMDIADNCDAARAAIVERINELMAADKNTFITKCRICGNELPLGYSYGICERCHRTSFRRRKKKDHPVGQCHLVSDTTKSQK